MEQATQGRSAADPVRLAADGPSCFAALDEGAVFGPGPSSISGDPRCVLAEGRWAQIRRQLPLSEREVQIIRRLFEGAHESDIAGSLGISTHTVHTHLGRIYRKLGVRSLPGMLLRVFGVYVNAVEQDAAGIAANRSVSHPSRARQKGVSARAARTTAQDDATAPLRSRLG